jgi:hypothetical protein
VETIPGHGAPWEREEVQSPGSITLNELSYNPGVTPGSEWIELHNPMAIDMDVSGWRLGDGVSFTFPEGTVIAAGGYLVVAADPAALADASGFDDAIGPFEGTLADGGERIDLLSNGGRRIDTLRYGDDEPWPVAPDGTGVTLAKLRLDTASDHAENWAHSHGAGGTPGRDNGLDPQASPTRTELVPLESTWRFDTSGAPASGWESPGFDDGGWQEGQAVFYAGASAAASTATLRITADNYYGVYVGEADGTDLRLVAEDVDGDWTTVETYDAEVTPRDHLFVAAWEAPWDYGGPQMTIAEAEVGGVIVGTAASTFEWILGPAGACPGVPSPPPEEGDLAALILDADTTASWALPGVDADRSASPWGWALSGSFDADTRYVWPDTFSDTSITNTENTYALFRSIDPVVAPAGDTAIAEIPVTAAFRTTFESSVSPTDSTLALSCRIDDGAVVYLNGLEVLRVNLPGGVVTNDTLATDPVTDDATVYTTLAADALVVGMNVLAVALHQAEAEDPDLVFGCSLTAITTAATATPSVVFDEVAAAEDRWVDLFGPGDASAEIDGLILASSAGDEATLTGAPLDPGARRRVDLDFPPTAGDVLALWSADGATLLDAVRVEDRGRARADGAGPWRYPTSPTPGEPNDIVLEDAIVVNEIHYHAAPVSEEGQPFSEREEEWIELYNRGDSTVDLSGWALVDAVAWAFPAGTTLAPGAYLVVSGDAAALRAAHPDIDIVGDFDGRLDNTSDRILLLDARGNPADEVRYHEGGRWPAAADGGGSSLELRDPRADNSVAEAWAASDETARAGWVSYRYEGPADPSVVGPDGQWNEFVFGLLDAGELLIDDLSVVRDPNGAAVETLQNGSFEDADSWRLLGNHRHSEVVADPEDPSNTVLRLVATGPTEHMHNHAETTLTEPITADTYAISFRARWVSGNNQLHTRLYFNRLPRTTRVARPTTSGTPGAPNTAASDNLGPTLDDLRQDTAVPVEGQAVAIRVRAADPDGVATVTLWSREDGGVFEATEMTEEGEGEWVGWIAGRAAGALVQFYVSAEDVAGATSTLPAAGPGSRALIQFDDGRAASNGLHNFRILMTQADSDWLLDDPNLMSNDAVGATVVYDESLVFYDVGVRAKGSERGRPEDVRLGYGVSFNPDQLFRGSHASVLVDRSEGVYYGQREMLLDLVMARAGLVSAEYNDLIQAITPRDTHTGPAQLQIDRYTTLVLAAQFEDGDAGSLYDYELVYYPLTTDDGTAEGFKLPQPDSVTGTSITDLGDDEEDWRWSFMLQNNLDADDFAPILDLGQTFALSDEDFLSSVGEVIDVDQWLRAFAMATLAGAVDNYGGDGSWHNARFYARPEDGRVLYFPHDLDFFGSSQMAVVGNGDLARLLQDPANERVYYGHLHDLIRRAYTTDYLAPWCDQIGGLLPAQDFGSHCQFVDDRAAWVTGGASNAITTRYPHVGFAITTGDGADFSTGAPSVTLEGTGWIDVRTIRLDGAALPVIWTRDDTWQVEIPLEVGDNTLTLVAEDFAGLEVGRDTIGVRRE